MNLARTTFNTHPALATSGHLHNYCHSISQEPSLCRKPPGSSLPALSPSQTTEETESPWCDSLLSKNLYKSGGIKSQEPLWPHFVLSFCPCLSLLYPSKTKVGVYVAQTWLSLQSTRMPNIFELSLHKANKNTQCRVPDRGLLRCHTHTPRSPHLLFSVSFSTIAHTDDSDVTFLMFVIPTRKTARSTRTGTLAGVVLLPHHLKQPQNRSWAKVWPNPPLPKIHIGIHMYCLVND